MANTANIRAVITAEDRASGALNGFGKSVDSLGHKFANVAKKAAIAFGAATTAAVTFGVKTAADFETARSALVGLLGSAEEADKTLARIKKEAASTPFELTGLTQGVKQLSSVTKTGDEAIDILLNVGKAITASGGGQFELDRVVFNLKQIKGIGQLSAIDLKELRRAIPIFDKLVEAAGTSVEEIQKAKDPAKALFDVFEKGGKKLEAVDKAFIVQAGNFNQLLSNMKDSLAIFLSDFVKSTGIFDTVKRAIKGVSDVLSNNKDSMINGFNEAVKRIQDVGRQVAEYLAPKLEALWNTISTKLLPVLQKLWKEVLEPLVPVIGTALVVAFGLAIDALNIFFATITPIFSWMLDNKGTVIGLATAFGILALAMNFHAIVAGFNAAINSAIISINILRLVTIPSALTSLGMFAAGFGPVGIAAVVAAGVIIDAGNKAKAAWDRTAQSIQSASTSNDAVIRNLQGLIKTGTPEQQQRARITLKKLADAGSFASGTNFAPGGMSLVGERGPEIVNLPRGSKVTPSDKTQRMMGGSTINLNVNVGMYAGTPMERRKLAETLWRDLQDIANQRNTQMGMM